MALNDNQVFHEFSTRLTMEMKLQKLKQVRVAEEIGAAPSTINTWQYFTPNNFRLLASLCKTLDIDANYLLGLKEEKTKLSDEPISIDDSCPNCGTTEFLCGHNGVGCLRTMQ